MVLLLTSSSELKRADLSEPDLLASFVVSVVVVLICLLVMIASCFYIRVMSKPDYNIETSFFREFHDSLKSTALGKWYMTMFLLRRFVCVSWVVFAADLKAYARIGTYAVFQTAILVYTCISRPFTDFWDNVIEILNDLAYAVLCGVLIAFNNKDAWSSNQSNAVIIFLCSNTMLVFGIQLIVMIISLYRFGAECIAKRRKKIQVTNIDATVIGQDVSRTDISSNDMNSRRIENAHSKENSRNANLNEILARSKKFTSNEVNMGDEEDN